MKKENARVVYTCGHYSNRFRLDPDDWVDLDHRCGTCNEGEVAHVEIMNVDEGDMTFHGFMVAAGEAKGVKG